MTLPSAKTWLDVRRNSSTSDSCEIAWSHARPSESKLARFPWKVGPSTQDHSMQCQVSEDHRRHAEEAWRKRLGKHRAYQIGWLEGNAARASSWCSSANTQRICWYCNSLWRWRWICWPPWSAEVCLTKWAGNLAANELDIATSGAFDLVAPRSSGFLSGWRMVIFGWALPLGFELEYCWYWRWPLRRVAGVSSICCCSSVFVGLCPDWCGTDNLVSAQSVVSTAAPRTKAFLDEPKEYPWPPGRRWSWNNQRWITFGGFGRRSSSNIATKVWGFGACKWRGKRSSRSSAGRKCQAQVDCADSQRKLARMGQTTRQNSPGSSLLGQHPSWGHCDIGCRNGRCSTVINYCILPGRI